MKLIFLGPPGAGKGTQAKLISKSISIPHISTGDIFRENLNEKTLWGQEASKYMDKGKLVPDDVTNKMVKERLSRDDCKKGYILDGYPRTINQAEFLDSIQKIDKVINFDLDEETIIKRISGRRTCSNCQKSYHIDFSPPNKEGICDVCGGKLVQRNDELPKTVKIRLDVYNKQTKPLIEYYEEKNILVHIDASPSIEEIFEKIVKELKA